MSVTMDHVAILHKSPPLLQYILSGQKTIESRWYRTRRAPWDVIKEKDVVYFKNSGEPITAKASVEKVLQFEDLTRKEIAKIIKRYGRFITSSDPDNFLKSVQHKKYCVLVFIKNAKKVTPFSISKKGFGIGNAWLTMRSINDIALKG